MTEVASVAKRAAEIQRQFGSILSSIAISDGAPTVPTPLISVEDVGNVVERFKLWAGDIGANHDANSSLSLETRLRDTPEILSEVSSLLDRFSEALSDVLAIVSGRRENRQIRGNAANCYEDEEQNESDFEDEGKSDPGVFTDEVHDVLGIASDYLGSLFRVSMLIRKATPRDVFGKALQQPGNQFMEQFDINYVRERYPQLAHPGRRWLLERLGRAITNRRQYLRYCRDHKERLEQPGFDQPDLEHSIQKLPGQSVSMVPSTKASTLDKTRLEAIMNQPDKFDGYEEEDDGRTCSTVVSSVGQDKGTHISLPKLEDVRQGQSIFECILCRRVQRFTRERTWRRHAYHDLKAYVCTTGKEECSLEMFGDQKAWFEHEMEKHRRIWVCAICKDGPFPSLDKFQAHIATHHPDFVDHQLVALVNVSQSAPSIIPAKDCPFCDDWDQKLRQSRPQEDGPITVDPHQFRRHVANHLHHLAVFAIPRGSEESDESDSLSVRGKVRSSFRYSSKPQSSSSGLSFETGSISGSIIEPPPWVEEDMSTETGPRIDKPEEGDPKNDVQKDPWWSVRVSNLGRREPKSPMVTIALLGMTGAGKTTFAALASSRSDLRIGQGIDPCTKAIQAIPFELDGQTIVLIDTPGFDNEKRSDLQILETMKKWLAKKQNAEQYRLDGLIFLHPITLTRIGSKELKYTRLLQSIVNPDAYEGVIIATTMWDEVKNDRQTTLGWNAMTAAGATVVRHDNNQQSAHDIIRRIIRRSESLGNGKKSAAVVVAKQQ